MYAFAEQACEFAYAQVERVQAQHGDSAAEVAAAAIQAQFMWLGALDLAVEHASDHPDPARRLALLAALAQSQAHMQNALAVLSLHALKHVVSDEQSLADVAASIRSAVENAAQVLAPEPAHAAGSSVTVPAPGTIQ